MHASGCPLLVERRGMERQIMSCNFASSIVINCTPASAQSFLWSGQLQVLLMLTSASVVGTLYEMSGVACRTPQWGLKNIKPPFSTHTNHGEPWKSCPRRYGASALSSMILGWRQDTSGAGIRRQAQGQPCCSSRTRKWRCAPAPHS